MNTWEDVQTKKAEMRREAVSTLSKEEKEILVKILDLEWENRHMKTPDIKKQLRTFIQQVVK